jgi:hypothetical protein
MPRKAPTSPSDAEIRRVLSEMGRRGGKKGGALGGKARWEGVSPEQRSEQMSKTAQARVKKLSRKKRKEIALKASAARWGAKKSSPPADA